MLINTVSKWPRESLTACDSLIFMLLPIIPLLSLSLLSSYQIIHSTLV